MYFYVEEDANLNSEEILLRVSQEEVFAMLLGEPPDTKSMYLSLVRQDNKPNCYFTYYNGKLYFVDFGHTKHHLDCFGVISEIYKCDFQESLRIVNNHFKLGLDGQGELAPVKYELPQSVPALKQETDIIFRQRPFNLNDKSFWSQYGITKQNLLEDSVVGILWYKFYSHRAKTEIIIRPKKITYGYTEFIPKIKIYSPYANKSEIKFLGNVDKNCIGGIGKLPLNGDRLIITKGYKDWRVYTNFGANSVWFQSEGTIPDNEHLISLGKRFDEIIVVYDNDETGIQTSEQLVSIINSHFPKKSRSYIFPLIENVKDTSDFYKYEGKFKLLNILTINNLI